MQYYHRIWFKEIIPTLRYYGKEIGHDYKANTPYHDMAEQIMSAYLMFSVQQENLLIDFIYGTLESWLTAHKYPWIKNL